MVYLISITNFRFSYDAESFRINVQEMLYYYFVITVTNAE